MAADKQQGLFSGQSDLHQGLRAFFIENVRVFVELIQRLYLCDHVFVYLLISVLSRWLLSYSTPGSHQHFLLAGANRQQTGLCNFRLELAGYWTVEMQGWKMVTCKNI